MGSNWTREEILRWLGYPDEPEGTKTVRLWVDGEDYGEMSERAAEMYLSVHRERYPSQPAWAVPVTEDEELTPPSELEGQ